MSEEITRFFNVAAEDDPKAADALLSAVYEELRHLAARKMASEAHGHTLQPTALVHEAWLRLTGDEKRQWNSRIHFFAAAAEAMRRILVDNARRKRAQRHGGALERVEMPDIAMSEREDRILEVNDAVEKLALEDPRKADLIKLRYFVGMTIEEAAEVLSISAPTAKRHWVYARAWLAHEINKGS